MNPLHIAVKRRSEEIVTLLLNAGANPLLKDENDSSAVDYASKLRADSPILLKVMEAAAVFIKLENEKNENEKHENEKLENEKLVNGKKTEGRGKIGGNGSNEVGKAVVAGGVKTVEGRESDKGKDTSNGNSKGKVTKKDLAKNDTDRNKGGVETKEGDKGGKDPNTGGKEGHTSVTPPRRIRQASGEIDEHVIKIMQTAVHNIMNNIRT